MSTIAGFRSTSTSRRASKWPRLSETEQGKSYLASWFAFGDLPVEAVRRSVGMFAEEVLPAFA